MREVKSNSSLAPVEMAPGACPRKICVQFTKYEGKRGIMLEQGRCGAERSGLESGDSVLLAGVILILALRNY
jgi:hypothetical protein